MAETTPKLTFREQMKGFPVWQMVVLSLIRFSEPIAFTSLFPYVYFMIRDFHIAKTPADIATYSGYLAASFAFFQFFFCVQWGRASDKVGRKRILMLGLAGTSVSMLIFGFSPNFYVAMFARSLMGTLNGNISVIRTSIGEIATERRHQGIAFSTLPLLWNLGAVVGPMVGGSKYLTRPKNPNSEGTAFIGTYLLGVQSEASNNDNLYERFLNKYPYALSNIVVACFLLFSLTMGFLFLEEPCDKFKKKRDVGLEIGDFILTKLGFKMPVRPWQKVKQTQTTSSIPSESVPTELAPLITSRILSEQVYSTVDDEDEEENVDNEDSESIDSFGPITKSYSRALVRRYSSSQLGPVVSRTTTSASILTTNISQSFTREIFTPAVIQTMVANFLIAFHNVICSEFLPVLLAGRLLVDELKFPFTIVGGFGYDSDSIGKLLSISGFAGAIGVMCIFPILDRNFKTLTLLRFSGLIFPVAYAIVPYLIFTRTEYNPNCPPWLTKTLLYILFCVSNVSGAVGFPNILILVHRSAPARHRAFVNSCALSMNSLSRFIGPISWGYLMSFSDKYKIGWLSWWVLSILALVMVVQTFFMKDYDEDEEDNKHGNDNQV